MTLFNKTLHNEELEIPIVKFENYEAKENVAKWLSQGYAKNEYRENTAEQFGYLLKLAGIDKTESCTIGFDHAYIFKCYFEKAKDEATIKLLDSIGEDIAMFEFYYQNNRKDYFYHPAQENQEVLFRPNSYIRENQDNGNTLVRNFEMRECVFTILNEENNFSLSVTNQSGMIKDRVSMLPKEEDLSNYLLGLSFPFEIEKAYKKICDLSLMDIKLLPHVVLETQRKGIKTDIIDLEYGIWSKFQKTTAGKTVSLDNKGEFTYQDGLIALENGVLTTHIPMKQISEGMVISPIEELKKIEKEVQKVKKITKNIFPSN